MRIGRVRSVNPSRREVRIGYDRATKPLDAATKWIEFDLGSDERLRCKIARVKSVAEGVVVLQTGVPRDVVARLRGAAVLVDLQEPACSRQLPLVEDLLDLRVVSEVGTPLGKVVDVFQGPANDVLRVGRDGGGVFLLPVIEPAILAVDLVSKTLTVTSDLSAYAVEEP